MLKLAAGHQAPAEHHCEAAREQGAGSRRCTRNTAEAGRLHLRHQGRSVRAVAHCAEISYAPWFRRAVGSRPEKDLAPKSDNTKKEIAQWPQAHLYWIKS